MVAIIFGINGQDGFYLNELLVKKNIQIVGVSRKNNDWIIGNIADRSFVESLIKQYKPDYIFHLAANSTTDHEALFENHESVSTGTLNILESVYKFSKHSKVFLSGSALQFANNGNPISEQDAFFAGSPYAIARIQSVYAARYYRKLGLKIYIGYFFNHDSPLRSERHINQKIVTTAIKIAAGLNNKLSIGNIHAYKEFTYANDTVNAVWKLICNDEIFETVIGSGKAYSIEDWLQLCFEYLNLNWQDHTIIKENFISEYSILVSNPTTLFKLGWQQTVQISELAKLMIEYGQR